MTTAERPDSLSSALRSARLAAEAQMATMESVGLSWQEETISELMWTAAAPVAKIASFTKREESTVGADWLWWWIDQRGEAFGMLVQAKRLRRRVSDGRFEVDFQYNNGQQRRALGEAARVVSVPATYVVYMGTPEYRLPIRCGREQHTEEDCEACHRRSVVVLPWILVDQWMESTATNGAATVLNEGTPLESLAEADGEIHDLNLERCAYDLRRLLLEGQAGARSIAKHVFAEVARARRGMFSLDVLEPLPAVDDRVFADVPHDSAHFPEPYYDNILRGLRRRPPAYVHDAVVGAPLPEPPHPSIAGVVVVSC